jgi:hypothetical protein
MSNIAFKICIYKAATPKRQVGPVVPRGCGLPRADSGLLLVQVNDDDRRIAE